MKTKRNTAKKSTERKVYFTLGDGKSRPIYVSKYVDDATYQDFKKILKLLAQSKRYGSPVTARDWNRIKNLPSDLRDKLADAGLIEAKQSRTLVAFLKAYLEERSDLAKRTKAKYSTSIKSLIDYFGNIPLAEVTHEKAALYRVHLMQTGFKEATVSKMIGVARLFLGTAKRRKLIDENPFQYVETGSQVNKEREHRVTKDEFDTLLAACANEKDRLIIALGQSGLRIPSELVGLRWSEIDWEKKCFVVHSPKTERKGKGKRIVPIFDLDQPCIKLRQYLLDALAVAPKDEDRIFPDIHPEKSMGSWISKLADRAGIDLWEKPFQNMRSTCANELREVFPEHVCNAWLGHTQKVAVDAYLYVMDEQLEKATQNSSSTKGKQQGDNEYRYNIHDFELCKYDNLEFWEGATTSQEKVFSNVGGNFGGFSSIESVVFYEAYQRLNPAAKMFFSEEYGGECTLSALNHFLVTYGNIVAYNKNGVVYGDVEFYEKSRQSQADEAAKKAPGSGLLEEEDSQGGTRTRTSLLTRDFKSPASAIPPLGQSMN